MIVLEKIVGYCNRIMEYLDRYEHNKDSFINDLMFQDACCMCVVQIDELVAQLSEEIKTVHKTIPWRAIKDTRNFYVHSYGAIDVSLVWDTLTEDIPQLKAICCTLLEKK